MWFDNLRAGLRNLYINILVCLPIVGYYFVAGLLLVSKATEELVSALHWANIAVFIAWILFFLFWVFELIREIRRSNYWFLLTVLPFILPPLVYIKHEAIASYLLGLFL